MGDLLSHWYIKAEIVRLRCKLDHLVLPYPQLKAMSFNIVKK